MVLPKKFKLLLVIVAIFITLLFIFVIFKRSKSDTREGEDRVNYIEDVFIASGILDDGTPGGEVLPPIIEAERIIAAAKLKKGDLSGVVFKAKWYYEDFSKFEPFFEAQVKAATDKKYLVSILKATSLPPKFDQFKVFTDIFPVGTYRVEWYSEGVLEEEVKFTVGQ